MLLIFIMFSYIICCEGNDKARVVGGRNLFAPFVDDKMKGGYIFKERIAGVRRTDLVRQGRVSPEISHEVVFVIKQRNIVELTAILHDISDPKSINYGKHKTGQEVADLTANYKSRDVVVSYLTSVGATVVSETLYGEFVTANGPIKLWEEMFHTEFFLFHQTQDANHIRKLVRAEHYSIPVELDQHAESVFNTVQTLLQSSGGSLRSPESIQDIDNRNNKKKNVEATAFEQNLITPNKLKAYYNISSTVEGNNLSTQAIFATVGSYFSPVDLEMFQENYQPPAQAVARSIGNHSSAAQCNVDRNICSEANLDLQYIMSTSKGSPTTYWYKDIDEWGEWLVTVANTLNPPLVLSMSYGSEEQDTSSSQMEAFNIQAIKLGVRGVTIVVSSGDDLCDDGANSKRLKANGCGYVGRFPASSPYVTSVGATQGVERTAKGVFNGGEVTCSSDNNGKITSGGGFSIYNPQPAFQKEVVDNYLLNVKGTNEDPVVGYNAQGRGYPDIAAAGLDYRIVANKQYYSTSGTSASAPFIAGLFSNINAKRLAAGKGSLGWVNPTLYQTYTAFINDITEGNNLCIADGGGGTCCSQGFYAAKGWDPTTGLGSVNYGLMEATLLSIGDVNAFTVEPTSAPTPSPQSSKSSKFESSIIIFIAIGLFYVL